MRRFFLAIFQRINPGEITVKHHWSGDRIRLHSFQHKGYWFHGRNRKRNVMEAFGRLITTGECVFDLGGHIGYTALYFSFLVGTTGRVSVFEPSLENLTYLKNNVESCKRQNIDIFERAVSDRAGTATLYCESLTGQNSTIVSDFLPRSPAVKYQACQTQTTTVDQVVEQSQLRPAFIKIDVEGAELAVLRGMRRTLEVLRPRLMIENNLYGPEIWEVLDRAGYKMHDELGRPLRSADSMEQFSNLFAFHRSDCTALARFSSLGYRQ